MINDNFIDIHAPELPESVINATIINWYKKEGDSITSNEILADIETDKIVLEVTSPAQGIIHSILKHKGSKICSKERIGIILNQQITLDTKKNQLDINPIQQDKKINSICIQKKFLSPKLRRLSKSNNLISSYINKYDYTKLDIHANILKNDHQMKQNNLMTSQVNNVNKENECFKRNQTRIPMSSMRKKISERLLESQKNMAMLTTFNEVNMQSIIKLRQKYKKMFEKKYKVKLGFMSFFVKAVSSALKFFPEINASIDNEDIIQYDYFDISIAISTSRGLITPVLKNVDSMRMSEIELKIKEFAIQGDTGKLQIEDLIGGNITISNGGIFGSLLSTPIINPPQSTILGMHTIKKRTMVINDNIQILPMMYLALSYDHRLIDGKQAVSFLIRIKENLEDVSRILLEI